MTLSKRSTPMRLYFSLTALLLIIGACAAPETQIPEEFSESTETINTSEKSSSAGDELAKLPPITMQPPERSLREGLPGPQAPGPKRLIGLGADQIQKMFGPPDFKRRDPPAEIWQYRKAGCMLDFFLYQKYGGAEEYSVTHVEARGRSVEEVSGSECLLEALAR